MPYCPYFWGVWSFSPNKTAAKELIEALMQREPVEQRCNEVIGYDVPPFTSMLDFKIWDGGRAAEGHRLQLPDPAIPQGRGAYRGDAGTAGDRRADLQSRHYADNAGEAAKAARRSTR